MPSSQVNPPAGRPLSPGAIALMLMLCLSWGFNQIAVKLVLPDVPPMLQALTRSAGALPVLLIIGWLRGVKFFERDGTLWPGLSAGILFGIEFVLIYRGLLLTSASRAVVFLYTAPFFVALGSYLFLGERLRAVAMGRAGLELCRRRGGDRRAAAQCRCQCAVRRSPDRRRRFAVGGDHPDRQGHRLDQGAGGKGPRLPGGDIDPDPRFRGVDLGRTNHPCSRAAVGVAVGLPGVLGGRPDVPGVVRDGQDLFRQQAVGLHLHHPVVRRRRRLFHHARHPDAGLRRRSACW